LKNNCTFCQIWTYLCNKNNCRLRCKR